MPDLTRPVEDELCPKVYLELVNECVTDALSLTAKGSLSAAVRQITITSRNANCNKVHMQSHELLLEQYNGFELRAGARSRDSARYGARR